tara:strand:- start:2074 stop:2397 length:324 start_codon:yes stop_codon:yes gene_type:complete
MKVTNMDDQAFNQKQGEVNEAQDQLRRLEAKIDEKRRTREADQRGRRQEIQRAFEEKLHAAEKWRDEMLAQLAQNADDSVKAFMKEKTLLEKKIEMLQRELDNIRRS